MELDPRIKSVSDILTPFDTERAREFIGQRGYFAGSIDCFRSGKPYCKYGTLTRVFDHKDQTDPFLKMEGDDLYSFFLPEGSLKPAEKKYRPYTLMGFCDKFTVGCPIKFRKKGEEGNENFLILNGYKHTQVGDRTITCVYIGTYASTLDDLFSYYEWQEHYTEDFKPFGVEVEE